MKINNVNLYEIQKFVAEAKNNPQAFVRKKKVIGDWNFVEGQAQFKSEIQYPHGNITLEADHADFMGGTGIKPDPIQYCLMGTCACFAGTYATIAASENVVLTRLRVSAENEVDLSKAMGITNNPMVRKVQITVEIESNADEKKLKEIEKLAMERCPGIYCLSNPIPVISELIVTVEGKPTQ